MTMHDEIAQRVKSVTARRWLDYSRKFGQSSQDCMTDAVIAMIVVANEQHLRDHGRQDLERFLEMGMDELEVELQRIFAPDEVPLEGADFLGSPDAGGAVDGGVVADGRGAGVRADEGSAVPLDGDPPV